MRCKLSLGSPPSRQGTNQQFILAFGLQLNKAASALPIPGDTSVAGATEYDQVFRHFHSRDIVNGLAKKRHEITIGGSTPRTAGDNRISEQDRRGSQTPNVLRVSGHEMIR